MIRLTRLAILLVVLAACGNVPPSARPPTPCAPAKAAPTVAVTTGDEEVRWLEERSMLHQASLLARRYSGRGDLWRHPYALPRPRAASARASVWFTAYPAATITKPGTSVLATLADPELWAAFQSLGVAGIHTGPMKLAGGLRGREHTPTIDGNFDRISSEIDPGFGSVDDYKALTKNAGAHKAIVIGDVIPGHSGKGADFRLAERAYKDYPGIFHMVEIAEKDWGLLPSVPSGQDAVNLKPEAVDELKTRGYIVGQLPRTIFYEKGVKETDFSATDVVHGVDGKKRRWVYLHYFKAGQPTFNWLDPSFAADRLVIGDALHSLGVLGASALRLDANGFLGIEIGKDGGRAWSEGHPLSITANQLIAGMVRKLGGFTFQELNLTLEDIKAMSEGGPDLAYDFVTRPAYEHALVTGDASFLRLMLGLERKYGIDPAGLIHALQNHDELTLELVHFWTKHKDEEVTFRGKKVKGSGLRDIVRDEMYKKLLAPAAPYNLVASNGVSCTTASLIAAALGAPAKDAHALSELSDPTKKEIQRAHLLLAMFNAMQPGVFALSGWDLVGAMTLPGDAVKKLMADGDTRWINRGAYDVGGVSPTANQSASGLPRAYALYGDLPKQLATPGSFASELKKMLEVRRSIRLNEAELVDLPAVKAAGLVVMVHRLPDKKGLEVTALNFGRAPIAEAVEIKDARAGATTRDLLDGAKPSALAGKRLSVALEPYQGRVLLLE